MSDTENKAVFLSYASQDAEATRRIAEALRAAGVEVWFDRSELVGGDAWDAKIRGQIAKCALFVPIISANTQQRREGYFRIEWKLAAQRTHAIAEGTPFLLPIALDGVQEAQALVPSEFREVQWTALSAADTVAPFCARVKHLTNGSSAEAGAPRRVDLAGQAETPARRRTSRVPLVIGAFVVVALGIAFAFVSWRRRPSSTGATPTLAKSTDRTRTAELAQRSSIETQDVLDVVVEHARRETEASTESAAAWSKRARLEAQYIVRGWDLSEQRRQDIQAHAKRALASDPASVDAMFALAIVFLHQGAFTEAESLMRKATAREPTDAELRQALGTALSGEGREAEALALRKETLTLFPGNPFAHYDLALSFEQASPPDLEAALRKFEDSIALQPFPTTILHKVSLLAGWKGDLSGAQRLLDTLDPLERSGDRAVGIAMTLGVLQHQPDRVLKAAGLTARTYFEDDYVRGPKAWLLAHAYTQAGKPNLALAQWREAEAILRQRLRATPESWFDQAGLAITLAWLGEQTEAASIMAPVEAIARESAKPLQSVYLAYYYAGGGDAAKAASYLRPVLERRELITPRTLPLDPWWDKVRAAPPFGALLSKPENTGGASALPAPDSKSVAVLAFRQLSADPENEYLCEAISDELCSVLGRVPGLKVAASASTFSFKGKRMRPSEIATQLGVAYLVDGRVQKIGSRVRVGVELIKASDESVVWKSDTLDREVKDMFAVQDEVVGAIAKNLQLRLGAASADSLVVNPEAYRLYYEGRRAWSMRPVREHVARAQEYFQRAVAIDPNLGRAYAGLADVAMELRGTGDVRVARFGVFGGRDAPELAEMLGLADKAIALEASSAEAHASRGRALFFMWRLAESEREKRAAIALNPNLADVHVLLGRLLHADGRMDEALRELQVARELDPLLARSFDNSAFVVRDAGRYTEALDLADRALAFQPGNSAALRTKVSALSALGRSEEAVALARRPEIGSSSAVILTLVRAGRVAEAQHATEALEPGVARVLALVALGRTSVALEALDKDTASILGIGSLFYEPTVDPLRADPRFIRFLDELGLTAAHNRAQAWRSAHPPEKPETKK